VRISHSVLGDRMNKKEQKNFDFWIVFAALFGILLGIIVTLVSITSTGYFPSNQDNEIEEIRGVKGYDFRIEDRYRPIICEIASDGRFSFYSYTTDRVQETDFYCFEKVTK